MATSLVQTERPLTLRKAPARFLNLPPATRQPAVSSPGRPIRPPRNLTPGQPCRNVFKVFVERGLLRLLAPRPPPNPLTKLSKYNPNAHCEFHQGPGHTTDRCFSLMHAVQDLIEQGKVVVYSSPFQHNFPKPSPATFGKCTSREQRICESHRGCPETRRPSIPDFFSIR